MQRRPALSILATLALTAAAPATLAQDAWPGRTCFDVASWQAINAPGGTPKPIIDRINAELTKIVAETQGAARLFTMSVENVPMTPAQFADFQFVKDGSVKAECAGAGSPVGTSGDSQEPSVSRLS